MKRVLFVDDEPVMLDGLRAMLLEQRGEWDMVFATGGHEALAELAKAPFDVVVSDMRMPGMDGAALLQKVKAEYPGVARIVLSDHAERDAVMRALPVAHQYLTKPCDAATLREVIERVCNLQAMLNDERLRQVIGKMDRLPSAPRTYWELDRVLARPNAGILEVAHIVADDPAMSLKLLQLSNSAFFGLSRQVASVAQAVSYLGIELVKNLALTAHVFSELEKDRPIEGFLLDDLQRDALLAAKTVKRMLTHSPKESEYAQTAAVIHDIGQLVVAIGMREEFAGVVQAASNADLPLHQAELEVLGFTHAEIGAYLLGIWGLPPVIVEAVACHHNPALVPAGFGAAGALHAAVAIADRELRKTAGPAGEIDAALLQRNGWAGELEGWRQIVREEVLAASGEAAPAP